MSAETCRSRPATQERRRDSTCIEIERKPSVGWPHMLRGLASLLCILTAGSATIGLAGDHPAGRPDPAGSLGTSRADGPAWAYPGSLPFFYDLYTFRGDAGRTAIVAAFAVPAGKLRKENAGDEVRYRFDVTLVLADTALRSVSRTDDTVFVAVPHSLDDQHLLHTYIEVQAPPSVSTLERVVMNDATTPGIGQLYGSPFPIPDYSGDRLMLSDVVLGLPDAKAGWRRGDVMLELLPTSQFPKSAFDVYYEIYNLPAGDPYATEIAVQRVGGAQSGSADIVRARFSGRAVTRPDGSVHELRHLGTSLGKGSYRLTVKVTDENTGETAERSREFEVRGWGRGATLVPALPWRTRDSGSGGA